MVGILAQRAGDCRQVTSHTLQTPDSGNANALWTVPVLDRPGLLVGNPVSRITCNSWDSNGPNTAEFAGERRPLPPSILFQHNCPMARRLKGNTAA